MARRHGDPGSAVAAAASPLIAFAEVGRVDLLLQVFETVAVARPAFRVAVEHASPLAALHLDGAASAGGLRLETVRRGRVLESLQARSVPVAEASTMVVALRNGIPVVAVDAPGARRAAAEMGLRAVGTLGIAVLAARLGLVEDARILDALVDVGRVHAGADVLREARSRLAWELRARKA